MPKSGLKDCGGWWVGVESDFSVKPPELNKMVTVLEIVLFIFKLCFIKLTHAKCTE